MISLDELEKISRIKNLSIKNTEKDYLLEMLLFLLFRHFGRILVFKGGTALYKLHSLNRFSEDLDFTLSAQKIELHKSLNKIIMDLKDIGIYAKIKELSDYRTQKNIKLELKGPLFDGNPNNLSLITINLSLKEKTLYEPIQEKIFSLYRDIASFDVFAMNLNEIFAEKIRTLFMRDKARDLYDAWFLLKKGVNFNIIDINKKLRLYKKIYDKEELINKLEEKKKFWDIDLRNIIIGKVPEFGDVLKDVKTYLKLT